MDRMLEALKQHGTEAVSFQALKAASHWWTDAAEPEGTGARIGYTPSGRSWIAIGTPLVDTARKAEAVRHFISAARAEGRRPVFFGIEDLAPFEGCRSLLVGLQSVLRPSEWQATLGSRPRLREQLRRARAKHVTVRAVEAGDLMPGTPLRRDVDRLRREWLASRQMEPMGFLVAVEPFHAAGEHLYFVAERGGTAVQFLSAVPIYAGKGWLMEDMLRGRDAPNGTTELVIDALIRRIEPDARWLTPGLTPLSGRIPWWLRLTKRASVALYDFSGLWRFRSRLRPAEWRPIWLAWDRGPVFGPTIDLLRLFAGGRILPFAARSIVSHPNGPPWAVAVPLVVWTALIAGLALAGRHDVLGFSRVSLWAWVIFDVVMAALLFKAAHRPRARNLAALAALACFDAVVSLRHLAMVGFGNALTSAALRALATAGPAIGTAALLWAAWRAHVAARPARD
jgi:phosphatidylglycerol lysyltransferase